MSIEKTLHVQKRSGLGKGANRRLRAESLVPGVFYNGTGDNIAVQVPSMPMEKLLTAVGRNTVFNIEIDHDGKKEKYPALIWDVQYHPYKRAFLHVDFYGVDLNKEIVVRVPVEFTGVSKGVKLGGQLETYRENVRLSGKPLDMPKKITIDVTDLDINASIHVADLALPGNISAVYSTNYCIVAVHVPGVEGEDAGDAAAASTAG
jgi:large subunit ribosomal protein L25